MVTWPTSVCARCDRSPGTHFASHNCWVAYWSRRLSGPAEPKTNWTTGKQHLDSLLAPTLHTHHLPMPQLSTHTICQCWCHLGLYYTASYTQCDITPFTTVVVVAFRTGSCQALCFLPSHYVIVLTRDILINPPHNIFCIVSTWTGSVGESSASRWADQVGMSEVVLEYRTHSLCEGFTRRQILCLIGLQTENRST